MKQIPDHPAIRAAERYGYPQAPVWPVCPICGEVCDNIFKRDEEIVGCNVCIHMTEADEVEECFPEEET